MQALLYSNLTTQTLSSSLGGSEITFPTLIQGDDLTLAIRTSETIEGEDVEVDRTFRALRAGIGRCDTPPDSGLFALAVDAVQKADLEYSTLDAATLETNLGGGVTVTEKDGSFIVESGTAIAITIAKNCLDPITFIRISDWECDGTYFYEIRFQQALVCYTESWSPVVPPAPSISVVQEGHDYDGFLVPEIQHLTVPPSFRGTYRLERGPEQFTTPLSRESSPAEIKAALDRIADTGGEFSVAIAFDGTAAITFLGTMSGIDHAPLTVTVIAAPPGDPTFTLSLNTAELSAMMRSVDEITLPFEIEAEIYNPSDEEIWELVTLYRGDITIKEQILREEDAEVQSIDWQRPPLPYDYVPWTGDQIITGSQHYTFSTAADGPIDHNLGTQALVIGLYNAGTGAALKPEDFVTIASDNSITLAGVVAAGITINGVITAAGPTSAFQAHTHTIAQIVGLQAILDDYGSRILALESLTPDGVFSRADEPAWEEQWDLPEFFEVFPYLGNRANIPAAPATLAGLDLSFLPNYVPDLLPALIDATAESLPLTASGRLIAPVAADKGTLFQNDSGATVTIPLASPVETVDDPYGYAYPLGDGEYAAHDGKNWYPLAQYGEGAETIYYPLTLERTLWQDTISASQLIPGRAYEVRFAVEVLAARANTPWHWHLVGEISGLTAEGSRTVTVIPENAISGGTIDASTDNETWELIDDQGDVAYTFDSSSAALANTDIEDAIESGLSLAAATIAVVYNESAGTISISGLPANILRIDVADTDGGNGGVEAQFATSLTSGGNLNRATWNDTPILDERLVLAPGVVREYIFGYRVIVANNGAISAEFLAFGEWYNALAPATSEFGIRFRLTRADTANPVTNPRGFLIARSGASTTSSGDIGIGKVF